jgi:VanZ family protein
MEIRGLSVSFFDKFLHMGAYGILASLIYLGLQVMHVAKRYLLILAFVISFAYGIANEIHQYFIPWRNAEILDVMANGIGAFCFPLLFRLKAFFGRGKSGEKNP